MLHVLDVSAPTIAGYASRSRALLNAQRALGLEPIVVTSQRHPNPARLEREDIDGIPHYRTLEPQRRSPALEVYHLTRRVREIARREGCQLVHGHSPILSGIPAWRAARRLRVPVVYEMRSLWEDAAAERGATNERAPRYRLIRAAETWLARRVDALVCICEGLRNEMLGRGLPAAKIVVVPNGVDGGRFAPIPPDEGVRARHRLGGKTVVAYIGTFFGFEGVPLLVKALIRLIRDQDRDDVRGLIVGSGPTYAECQALAARAGLADKIIHPGVVSHDQVQALYSVVDVLVYPRVSLRITELVTPLKPLEGMAMEKAVIGSDVGGLRELIDDGVTGLLHRHGDLDDLAKVILRVVDDEPLRRRLARAAHAWVRRERDWRTLAGRYVTLYERLGGAAPAGRR